MYIALLDSTGNPMTPAERGFWENVVGCVLACHVTASFKRDGETVQSAFLWADVALREYRKRLAAATPELTEDQRAVIRDVESAATVWPGKSVNG